MFTEEAIKFIYEQAGKKSLESRICDNLQCTEFPPGHVLIEDESGGIHFHKVPQFVHRHQASDLQTLIGVLHDRNGSSDLQAEIWINKTSVEGILEPSSSYRTEDVRVSVGFTFSKPFQLLSSWDSTNGLMLSQAELILWLRTTFHCCFNSHPNMLSLLRKIDTRKAQEASGVVERSNVSISKKIIAEVSGLDQLPETLVLDVPVLVERPFRANVHCAFEFDPSSERFKIVPYPGEINNAIQQSVTHIHGELLERMEQSGLKAPIYHGTY